MNKFCQIIILTYTCLVLFVVIHKGEANDTKVHRERRYLVFENISHFFMRINFKANMVPWNQIFAQAVGFRLNYDEPPTSFHPYHHFTRRTAYTHLETILDRSGINGFQCIRRAICEMAMMQRPQSLYYKVLSIVFRQQTSETDRWHNATKTDCQISILSCPFSMLEVSTYTDL